MPIMTWFIDVDLTLIDIDDKLLPGVEDGLRWMAITKGYKLYCWSAGGEDYARRMLAKNGILHFFRDVFDKPDGIIDDSPEHLLNPHRVIKINRKDDWTRIKDLIFRKDTSLSGKEEDEEIPNGIRPWTG